jgi:hypothetical protein
MSNPYQQGGGSGKFIMVLFTIIIFTSISFYLFGSQLSFTNKLHNKLFGEGIKFSTPQLTSSKQEEVQLTVPPPENEFCKIQEIKVPEDDESYSRDRILGWDSRNNCCYRQLEGYNCALGKQSRFSYCYTSQIGGKIKYAQVEGYYVDDENNYESYVNDLDKKRIENKNCYNELTKYPEGIKPK